MSFPSSLPPHWRTFPNFPTGTGLPEITQSELLRILTGAFTGLHLAATTTPTVDYTEFTVSCAPCCRLEHTVHHEITGGTQEGERDHVRSAETDCLALNCAAEVFPVLASAAWAVPMAADTYNETNPLTITTSQLFEGTIPPGEDPVYCADPINGNCEEPVTPAPDVTSPYYPIYSLSVTHFRIGTEDDAPRLVFCAVMKAIGYQVAIYSGAVDPLTFYGVSFDSIDGDWVAIAPAGGSLFGISLNATGYRKVVTHDTDPPEGPPTCDVDADPPDNDTFYSDLGDEEWTGTFAVTEI